jgi:hypothetical protein
MDLSDANEKSPVASPGIDPRTFQLVAQCLSLYATPDPVHIVIKNLVKYVGSHSFCLYQKHNISSTVTIA